MERYPLLSCGSDFRLFLDPRDVYVSCDEVEEILNLNGLKMAIILFKGFGYLIMALRISMSVMGFQQTLIFFSVFSSVMRTPLSSPGLAWKAFIAAVELGIHFPMWESFELMVSFALSVGEKLSSDLRWKSVWVPEVNLVCLMKSLSNGSTSREGG